MPVKKIEELIWNLPDKTVGVLGLSFKPDTDDLRCAPALDIIAALIARGVRVMAYDPASMAKAKAILKKGVRFCSDAYETASGSDCLVIATE